MAFVVLPVFAFVLSIAAGNPMDYLSLMVLAMGSLLAVLVGVGTACRDLRGGVETFWRSRPIDARRWLLVKYLIGLFVLQIIYLLALCAHVGVVAFLDRQFNDIFVIPLLFNRFSLVLIYSVAFVLGCLVRQAVPRAILSLAAVLLIYFLPVLIPAAGWLEPPTP